MAVPMRKMTMSEDKRGTAEEAEARFVGIPNAPTQTPTQPPPPPCLRVLHPDHVAVGSPITRVPLVPSSTSYSLPPSSTLTDPMWAHDLPNDFSRLNLFDGEIDSYPYHHHNTALFEKGFTFSSPDNLGNYMYHHILDQRRKHLQGTSGANANYQILRDRFVSPQSHGGVRTPVRFSPLNSTANNNPSHYYYAAKEKASIDSEQLSHVISPRRVVGDPSGYRCDNSIIIQGREAKQCFENGYSSTRGFRRSPRDEASIHGVGPKSFSAAAAASGQNQNNGDFTLPMLLDFYSVPDAQCYIYNLAKDQNGCRFLQRLVDEGTYQDMCMVFEGIIGSVVELMIDSFGNYLVQKLLDVCTDQQRLQIVFMLTNQPGQLVRISLNTHGTRVVQKLIETLNSAEQVSMVKSAIQPGFLDLIRDLNGNHVIQRCLQCLSCQDNQFIFDAAVKFCVEIATHRHGCCVMQRCIDYSVGKNRDKLVTEICKHGLLLSQDPFGNYVVQYVIEMDTPAASAKLLGLFKGNYVNLSTQKFSSHVVEKCLKHIGDTRSRIVRELLSAPHFEQLLQDPFANYVIQSALAVTKGPLHGTLVEAVRPHKILRTSPYCKRIFSGSLLKK